MKPMFNKNSDKLIPAIIQDDKTDKVLMLGYMNEESYNKTQKEKIVTFYSRSKKRLWTKGETSGNFLNVKKIILDCDNDAFLIKAEPAGPVCHTGKDTCFNEINEKSENFLYKLEKVILSRKENPTESSYTNKLFEKGINKIAQKVGEEAVELIIEAKDNNDDSYKNEFADLLYHLLVLNIEKGFNFCEIIEVLKDRSKS